MARSNELRFDPSVLVVMADPACRKTLERACRAAGVQVRALSRVAEVERWPEGEIVITDAAHVTPVWRKVGAVEVIALVRDAQEGYAALDRGASKWLPIGSSAAELTAAVRSHVLETQVQPSVTSESRRTNADDVRSGAIDALDQFLCEDAPGDVAKAPRESIHEWPAVSHHAGQRVWDKSNLSFEQTDATITLRPAKDRRRPVRGPRFRPSPRAYAFAALAAVLGGGACFALFRDSVPTLGSAPTAPTLNERPAPSVATVDTTESNPLPSAPAPSGLATVAPVESRAPQDLTGRWAMTNQIQSSGHRPYQGLRLAYRLQLRQEGTRISGAGHKWLENGRAIPRANRTPINVTGVVGGSRMELTFSERGRRRQSHGTFDLELASDGVLRGKFESDAARSRGSSVAQRVKNDDIEPR